MTKNISICIFVTLDGIMHQEMSLSSVFCHSEWNFFIEYVVIKCHLSRLMGERKLKISDVARDTGLHRNTVTLLYQETATRIDLDAVDAMCRYFGVQVGDLFEFTEDGISSAK